jgi:hypothetical protein
MFDSRASQQQVQLLKVTTVRNGYWVALCLYNSDKKFVWVLYCIRIDFLIPTFGGLYENHAVQSGISVTFLKSGEHDSSIHFQTHIKQCKTSISILNTEMGNKFRFTLSRIKKKFYHWCTQDRRGGSWACISPPQMRNLKNTDFVDTIISTVLCDIHCKT